MAGSPSQEELHQLRADLVSALAMGALRVKAGDRDITYRSVDDMKAALAFVDAQLGNTPKPTRIQMYSIRD
jgi:hypothetical protein